jgi:hypothetical protein
MAYFTDAGPESGPILWGAGLGPIKVLDAPDRYLAIGTATPAGQTEGGLALWQLTIGGAALPGRWLVLGREFLPVGGRKPRG